MRWEMAVWNLELALGTWNLEPRNTDALFRDEEPWNLELVFGTSLRHLEPRVVRLTCHTEPRLCNLEPRHRFRHI